MLAHFQKTTEKVKTTDMRWMHALKGETPLHKHLPQSRYQAMKVVSVCFITRGKQHRQRRIVQGQLFNLTKYHRGNTRWTWSLNLTLTVTLSYYFSPNMASRFAPVHGSGNALNITWLSLTWVKAEIILISPQLDYSCDRTEDYDEENWGS